MNGIAAIVPDVLERLEASGHYAGAKLRTAFSGTPFPASPEIPVLIVGLGAVTLSGYSVGDRLNSSKLGKRVNASVKIQIISPSVLGAERCTEIFSDLCGDLLFDPSLGVVRMAAGEIKLNAQRRAYEMTAVAVLDTLYYQP